MTTTDDKRTDGGVVPRTHVAYLFGLEHRAGEVEFRGKTFRDAGMFAGPPHFEWAPPDANPVLLLTAAGQSPKEAAEQILLLIGQDPRHGLQWTVRMPTMRAQLAQLGI